MQAVGRKLYRASEVASTAMRMVTPYPRSMQVNETGGAFAANEWIARRPSSIRPERDERVDL
jgi:hypothetical protein